MKKLILSFSILSIFVFIGCKQSKAPYTIQKKVIAEKAMVVTAYPLASKIGMEIIKKGGNAADAAIAVQFALAVVYPYAGNLGGGGFMVMRNKDASVSTLDFREKAPARAFKDMYLDSSGNAIDSLSRFGHLSVGVPGTVDGIFKIFKKYSKLKDFKKLIEPSIKLAEDGFAVTEKQAERLNDNKITFQKHNSSDIAFVKNVDWKKGDLLVQPELANTLKRILEKGESGFYEGETADFIVKEMNKGGGIITHEDLKN